MASLFITEVRNRYRANLSSLQEVRRKTWRVLKDPSLRHHLTLLMLINSGNMFNYLFQMILARNLSPDEYGIFNSLNSLIVMITLFITALPLTIAKFTIQMAGQSLSVVKGLFLSSMKAAMIAVLILSSSVLIFFERIQSFLHIDSGEYILLMLLQTACFFFLPVPMGVIQGLKRFAGLGLATFFHSVTRLLGLFLLVVFWKSGIRGAFMSGILGSMASLGTALFFMKDIMHEKRTLLPEGTLKRMTRYAIPLVFLTSTVSTMGNLDLILVRHFCSPEETGYYATAAILGRIAFYLPAILIMALFPTVAESHGKGQKNFRALGITLFMTLFIGGGFTLLSLFFPETLITALFGKDYLPSVPLFRITSTAMTALALSNVFFTYFAACSDFTFLKSVGIILAGMLLAVFFCHETAFHIALILLAANMAMLLASGTFFFLRFR